MFIGRENMSTIGGLAIGVPGELRAYEKAYQEFGGGVAWKDLFQPTIDLCRNGFVLSESLGQAINQTSSSILNDPTLRFILRSFDKSISLSFSRALFVKNNQTNELYTTNDTMKRPKYADTLEIIANQGVDAYYTGILADQIVKEIQDHGGIITKQDLADYQVDFQQALNISLNDSLTAFTTQAPSSGPILTFILNILRGYNVDANELKNTNTASLFYHRLIESFKFAFAKRAELGDPAQVNITDVCTKHNRLIEYREKFLF